MKKVSIITVNFNHNHVTEELLASVFEKNEYPDIEIIVVDNGSKTDPVPEWKIKYPTVTFIKSPVNVGFAAGNNLGIKAATGEYLFLVNNDTEFTGDLVKRLAGTLDQEPQVGIVSPKICYFDPPFLLQYVGYTGMNYYTGRNRQMGLNEMDNGQYNLITGEAAYAHGAAMMVRREAIRKAGLMPENFFLYYEELDWCESINRAGYEIWVNMQAMIYHKESVSVGKNSAIKEYFMNRNRILFIRRNATVFQRWVFYLYFIFFVAPRNTLTYLKNGQSGFIKLLGKAIWWNFTNDVNSTYLGYPI